MIHGIPDTAEILVGLKQTKECEADLFNPRMLLDYFIKTPHYYNYFIRNKLFHEYELISDTPKFTFLMMISWNAWKRQLEMKNDHCRV